MPKKICMLLLATLLVAISVTSFAQVSIGVSVRIGPPPLPVYVQPPVPAPGYIWQPGYWAYGDDGYYWVPGTWVEPPVVGVLWTPGYWGWRNGFYVWSPGYWGPHVGFYGGIVYGFGYTGVGFAGGYWRGGVYNYNRSVTNVNVTNVTNVYNTTVINNHTTNVSYNGGTGGTTAQPTAAEQVAAREHHIAPTALQTQHQQSASTNRGLLASTNHGQPTIAASPKAGVFNGQGVVAASKVNAANSSGRDGFKPFSATKTSAGNNGPNSGNGNGGSSGKGFGGGNGNGNGSYKPSNASVTASKVNSANSSGRRDDFKPFSETKTAGGNNGRNSVYGNNGGSGKGYGGGNGTGNGSYKPGNASMSDMRMRGNNNMASAPPPPHPSRSNGGQQHHNNGSHGNQNHKTEK